MDRPVTLAEFKTGFAEFRVELRAELKTELAEFRAEFRAELRAELKTEIAALEGRLMAAKRDTDERLIAMEQRLMAELGRHTRAANEELASRVGVVDDKYQDLPRRVTRLEEAVFASPAPRRRSSRKSAR